MDNSRIQIQQSLLNGTRKGWHGFVWMMKIVVPVSLLTALLAWSGWLEKSQPLIQPIMQWINLPAEAALPLIIGTTSGIYGAMGAMTMLPLSKAHMTLIAVFILIAHALIQECIIQGKSGINPLKAAAFRLISATVAVIIVSCFLDLSAPMGRVPVPVAVAAPSLAEMLAAWLKITALLALKMLVIMVSVLGLLEITKTLGWIDRVVGFCRPVFRMLGLDEKAGAIWITAAVFGLVYGAAVIVEESKEGYLNRRELESLQLSIGINHAMIEDTALFMALGLNFFWLAVPRLLTAMVAVRLNTMLDFAKSATGRRRFSLLKRKK